MKAMNKYLKIALCLALCIGIFACDNQEIDEWDTPFVHIMRDNKSSITVKSNRRDVVSYYIYYSTEKDDKDLKIDYSVKIGDGLTEGIDFEFITKENPLLFPSGIYQRPIQIRWLDNQINPEKDNTIRVKIESVDRDISIGLPGPDKKQSELIIEKVN